MMFTIFIHGPFSMKHFD